MKIDLILDKRKKYILACSFGPDSMALCDLLVRNHINFVIAHVNYHLREESDLEELNLEKYCLKNNINLFIKESYYGSNDKNIEAWARKERYEFFCELSNQLKIKNILIAHNLDDHLETYLLQKKRNSFVTYYGLNKKYEKNGIIFYRPLLEVRKHILFEYCKENKVPFSIDKSNFDNKYERNNLRNSVISKMKENKILNLEKEINDLNEKQKSFIDDYNDLINDLILDTKRINNLDSKVIYKIILFKLNRFFQHSDFSYKECLDLLEKINNNKKTIIKKNHYTIYYSYNKLIILSNKNINYSFTAKNNGLFAVNFKNLNFENKNNLTIRNVKLNDIYFYNGIKKKVSRIFIDQKIPYGIRNIWPGLYYDNQLIYMPHYQENYVQKDSSIIKFDIYKLIYNFYFI